VLLFTEKETLAHDLPPDPIEEETSKVKKLQLLTTDGAVMETIGALNNEGIVTNTVVALSTKDQFRAHVEIKDAVQTA